MGRLKAHVMEMVSDLVEMPYSALLIGTVVMPLYVLSAVCIKLKRRVCS